MSCFRSPAKTSGKQLQITSNKQFRNWHNSKFTLKTMCHLVCMSPVRPEMALWLQTAKLFWWSPLVLGVKLPWTLRRLSRPHQWSSSQRSSDSQTEGNLTGSSATFAADCSELSMLTPPSWGRVWRSWTSLRRLGPEGNTSGISEMTQTPAAVSPTPESQSLLTRPPDHSPASLTKYRPAF